MASTQTQMALVPDQNQTDYVDGVPSIFLLGGPNGVEDIEESESELEETHRKLMLNESRTWLLRSLLDRNRCTRDIYSFASNQAANRIEYNSLDPQTIKAAMRSKMKDMKLAIKQNRIVKRKQEQQLLYKLNNRSLTLRKKLRKIRSKMREERSIVKEKFQKKITHYMRTQSSFLDGSDNKKNLISCPTIAPRYLGDFSTAKVFNSSDDFPKPVSPLGPFLCDVNIKLSKGENKLLARDPKFSLKLHPNEIQFATEIERMNSKQRYNEHSLSAEKKKRGNGISTRIQNEGKFENTKNPNDGRLEKVRAIFDKNRDRRVYNPVSKSVNFTRRRATDYKLNRNVILPKPIHSEGEFFCEFRRRKYQDRVP